MEMQPLPASSPSASNVLSDELFITPYDNARKPISMANLPTPVIAPVSFEKSLSCSICCRLYDKAQTSNLCLHSFCELCINEYLRKGNKECPNCRTKLISRRDLRSNTLLDGIVKAVYSGRVGYEARLESFSKLRECCLIPREIQTRHSQDHISNAELIGSSDSLAAASDCASNSGGIMPPRDAEVSLPVSSETSQQNDVATELDFESVCDEILVCLRPHPDMQAAEQSATGEFATSSAYRIKPELGNSTQRYIAVERRADLRKEDIALTLLMPTKAWTGDRTSLSDDGYAVASNVLKMIFKDPALRNAFAEKTHIYIRKKRPTGVADDDGSLPDFLPFNPNACSTSSSNSCDAAIIHDEEESVVELFYLTPTLNEIRAEADAVQISGDGEVSWQNSAGSSNADASQLTSSMSNDYEVENSETENEFVPKNRRRKRQKPGENESENEVESAGEKRPFGGNQWLNANRSARSSRQPSPSDMTNAVEVEKNKSTTKKRSWSRKSKLPQQSANLDSKEKNSSEVAAFSGWVLSPPAIVRSSAAQRVTSEPLSSTLPSPSTVDVDPVVPLDNNEPQMSESERKYPLRYPVRRLNAYMKLHGAKPSRKLWKEMRSCPAERFEYLLQTKKPESGGKTWGSNRKLAILEQQRKAVENAVSVGEAANESSLENVDSRVVVGNVAALPLSRKKRVYNRKPKTDTNLAATAQYKAVADAGVLSRSESVDSSGDMGNVAEPLVSSKKRTYNRKSKISPNLTTTTAPSEAVAASSVSDDESSTGSDEEGVEKNVASGKKKPEAIRISEDCIIVINSECELNYIPKKKDRLALILGGWRNSIKDERRRLERELLEREKVTGKRIRQWP